MENAEALTSQQIGEFLKGSEGIEFTGQSQAEVYRWTERILISQEYAKQGKKRRGAIRSYVSKVTGLSMPQITRLIRSYRETGRVAVKPFRRCRFPGKYTGQDVTLLAAVDRTHQRLSGPATREILLREYKE